MTGALNEQYNIEVAGAMDNNGRIEAPEMFAGKIKSLANGMFFTVSFYVLLIFLLLFLFRSFLVCFRFKANS
jgi:hypothetical protein